MQNLCSVHMGSTVYGAHAFTRLLRHQSAVRTKLRQLLPACGFNLLEGAGHYFTWPPVN